MSESEKIQVLLRAVGSAPVLKKQTFMLSRSHQINFVINFLSKKMCKDDERIFIYIHQSFSPTPDTNVGLLYDNYQSDNKLVLHYSKSPAWG
jgi:ubiquitin-like protein ATG12